MCTSKLYLLINCRGVSVIYTRINQWPRAWVCCKTWWSGSGSSA